MTFLGWLECVDYQEVRCCCKIGFGSRGSWVRIPSPRQTLKTTDLQAFSKLISGFLFALYAKITAKYCHILPINDYFYHKIREESVRLW